MSVSFFKTIVGTSVSWQFWNLSQKFFPADLRKKGGCLYIFLLLQIRLGYSYILLYVWRRLTDQFFHEGRQTNVLKVGGFLI